VARRWVERRDNPVRYCLGGRLGELMASVTARGLRSRLQQVLAELGRRVPAVNWVFAEGMDGEVVGSLQAERGGPVTARRGSPMAAYASASALVYQAWSSETEREQFRARHPFAEFGAGLWRDEAELDGFLAAARSLGYVAPALPPGNVRVAVPVLAVDGRLHGALGGFQPCEPVEHAIISQRLAAELQRALISIHPQGESL